MLWLIEYPDHRHISARWGVPISVFTSIQQVLTKASQALSTVWITPGTLGTHTKAILTLTYSQEMARQCFPPVLQHCTWIVDGTHTPVKLYPSRNEEIKHYYSFKFKKPALNTQVFFLFVLSVTNKCCPQLGMLPDGTWGFVSSSDPAGKNPDIAQIRNSGFGDLLEDEDVANGG